MLKITFSILLTFSFLFANAQISPIPKAEEQKEVNQNLSGDGEFDIFNNLSHPLAITGGFFVLGGAATYIVGSEINNSKYSPKNTTQFIGIGVFAVGAVLFTVFSTERNENAPKRKKVKQKYKSNDWDIPK